MKNVENQEFLFFIFQEQMRRKSQDILSGGHFFEF